MKTIFIFICLIFLFSSCGTSKEGDTGDSLEKEKISGDENDADSTIIQKGIVTFIIPTQEGLELETSDSLIYVRGLQTGNGIIFKYTVEGVAQGSTNLHAGNCRVEKKSADTYLLTPSESDSFSISILKREAGIDTENFATFNFKLLMN